MLEFWLSRTWQERFYIFLAGASACMGAFVTHPSVAAFVAGSVLWGFTWYAFCRIQ
jgi:hypothetical protein